MWGPCGQHRWVRLSCRSAAIPAHTPAAPSHHGRACGLAKPARTLAGVPPPSNTAAAIPRQWTRQRTRNPPRRHRHHRRLAGGGWRGAAIGGTPTQRTANPNRKQNSTRSRDHASSAWSGCSAEISKGKSSTLRLRGLGPRVSGSRPIQGQSGELRCSFIVKHLRAVADGAASVPGRARRASACRAQVPRPTPSCRRTAVSSPRAWEAFSRELAFEVVGSRSWPTVVCCSRGCAWLSGVVRVLWHVDGTSGLVSPGSGPDDSSWPSGRDAISGPRGQGFGRLPARPGRASL